MITFDAVTKRFPDGTIGIEQLDLEIPSGEITVLVGPSGCGKTTAMRLVNRLLEPTQGRVLLHGEDVRSVPAAELRRGIGYVIQQIGLFPHRTTGQNIATVPVLRGWDKTRIQARVEELLDLVGLPPETSHRYPDQLSGGQRQRVGVARALAADPPVLLMDEPFGAVDPLLRGQLQDELLRLQDTMHKTILFVTHDIDEAIKLGDRVVLMSPPGKVEQFATPATLLAEPANDFVVQFLGAERGLKRLSLIKAGDVAADPGPPVHVGDSRAQAVASAAAADTDWVAVLDHDDLLLGWCWLAEVGETVGTTDVRPFVLQLSDDDSLRTALDALVTSRVGVAVRVDAKGRYHGILTRQRVSEEIL